MLIDHQRVDAAAGLCAYDSVIATTARLCPGVGAAYGVTRRRALRIGRWKLAAHCGRLKPACGTFRSAPPADTAVALCIRHFELMRQQLRDDGVGFTGAGTA